MPVCICQILYCLMYVCREWNGGRNGLRDPLNLHPDCELIFISGYSDREYLKSAIHLSALDYISKPLDLNELDEILSRAVEHVKKNNERQALVSYFMENELASVIVQDNVSNEEKMRLWSQLNSPRTDKLTLYTILMRQKYSRTTNLIIKEVAEKLGAYSGTFGRRIRNYPDTVPALSGQ